MRSQTLLLVLLPLFCFGACSEEAVSRVNPDEIVKLDINDVPSNVLELVTREHSGFEVSEVIKKVRDGRVYYDVEGEILNGEEIEFDVLMTDDGPTIVEIQKDILWGDVPVRTRALVDEANVDNLDIVRVIESKQTDASIIYEIFVADVPSDPVFEVRVKTDGEATLLDSRWEH